MATETQIAWAAGFFDGEGCIHIGRQRHGTYTNYQLVVRIVQKDRKPLEELVSISGHDCMWNVSRSSDNRKYWVWAITGPRAAGFLETILPYLILKKTQAELALEFQGRPRGRKKDAQTGRFIAGDHTEDEEMYELMKTLKKAS